MGHCVIRGNRLPIYDCMELLHDGEISSETQFHGYWIGMIDAKTPLKWCIQYPSFPKVNRMSSYGATRGFCAITHWSVWKCPLSLLLSPKHKLLVLSATTGHFHLINVCMICIISILLSPDHSWMISCDLMAVISIGRIATWIQMNKL